MPWVRRPRHGPPLEPAPEAEAPQPPAPPAVEVHERVAPPGHMRRERRALGRRREMEIRDVGGLAVEMVRRDRFRPELLVQRASEVLDLEQRLHELDSLLFTQVTARRELRGAPPCQCGAPLLPGAHFCSHCGRPALVTPPLVTCAHCGRPLPADANFCSFCGNSAAGADLEAAGDDFAETIARPWAGEERAGDA